MSALLDLVNHRYGTWRGAVRLALAQTRLYCGNLATLTQPDLSRVDRLVFVCLGNICRSPIAEARARTLAVPTASLGLSTTTGAPAYPGAVVAATTQGLDLQDHRATDVHDFAFQSGDLLLLMELRHAARLRQHALPAGAQLAMLGFWGRPRRIHVHDPHVLSEAYFRNCAAFLVSAVDHLVADWQRARSGTAA